MEPFFVQGHLPGLLAIALLVIYVLVKDIVVPLLRSRRTNNNPYPGHAAYAALDALVEEHHQEQLRINTRFEQNFRRLHERIDKLSERKTA
jgi:hypothetical protein